MDLGLVLQVATAISALLAVAASVYIMRTQILSSKEIAIIQISQAREQADKQIASTVLSANRQNWINDLRDTIANFVVSVHYLNSMKLTSREQRSTNDIAIATNNCWLHLSRIRLLINPNEDLHIQLLNLSNAFLDSITQEGADHKPMEANLIICAQKVLKAEWERVKKLA